MAEHPLLSYRLPSAILFSCLLIFLLLFQLDLLPHLRFPALQSHLSHFFQQSPQDPSLTPMNSSHPYQISPHPAQNSSHPAQNSSRLAVCIVGGARAFELTGPSIKKYLLQAHSNVDVFLHAPLDKDTYKLYLLKDVSNLAHVRIFTPKRLSERKIFSEVLTASNSPRGLQGLLQYFNLVEGCINMIEKYGSKHEIKYDWIIRTRLDSYWNGYLPSLDKMDRTAYIVPVGSQFGGLNDRLGIGNWKTSKVALSRLSLLPVAHAHGLRGLNSETYFKQQLKLRNVKYKLKTFPFCILSHRTYGWPPGRWGVPVLSISSKGPLNGAKCRPCTPVATGAVAKSIVKAQERSWAWTGSNDGLELCKATGDWEANWEETFDRVAGPEFQDYRTEILKQNLSECIKNNEAFKKLAGFWDAPSAAKICKKGLAS